MTAEAVVAPDGTVLATVVGAARPAAPVIDGAGRYVLSRFAYLHREGDDLVLESPMSATRVVLQDWQALALVHALRRPRSLDQLRDELPSVATGTAHRLLAVLVGAEMAVEDGEEGPSLRTWEFHDLLFHARVRGGRHEHPVGGSYRFVGQLPPPPATASVVGGPAIELPRPDLDRIEREDPPLAAVQEARRSIRQYAAEPLDIQQLGEFLYRVGRIADFWRVPLPAPDGPLTMDYAARPYPAAGGVYELELHCAVNACAGVPRGFYRYDAEHHSLVRTAEPGDGLTRLLLDSGRAAAIDPAALHVVVVVAARTPRVAWKYQSIAYSLVLKNVGVLFQTMYLAATAMGLAPCALGYGDSELFCRLAQTDYYAETSVGEFLLGRPVGAVHPEP